MNITKKQRKEIVKMLCEILKEPEAWEKTTEYYALKPAYSRDGSGIGQAYHTEINIHTPWSMWNMWMLHPKIDVSWIDAYRIKQAYFEGRAELDRQEADLLAKKAIMTLDLAKDKLADKKNRPAEEAPTDLASTYLGPGPVIAGIENGYWIPTSYGSTTVTATSGSWLSAASPDYLTKEQVECMIEEKLRRRRWL